MPSVGVVSVAFHGQYVRVHRFWHAFRFLHHTKPIELGGPRWLAGEGRAAGAGICIHPRPVEISKTVARRAVFPYLPQRLTHPGGTTMPSTRHEAAAACAVDVVAAVVARRGGEHETLRQREQ